MRLQIDLLGENVNKSYRIASLHHLRNLVLLLERTATRL
jgi:hypothetical protein